MEESFFIDVPMLKWLSVLQVMTFAVNVRRMLKRQQFDIIHSFERTLYQDIYRAGDGCHREWLAQRRKIDPPGKSILHRINPLHIALLWIEKQIFKEGNYKAIMANSQGGKKKLWICMGFRRIRFMSSTPPWIQSASLAIIGQETKEKLCRQFGINPDKSTSSLCRFRFPTQGTAGDLEGSGSSTLSGTPDCGGKGTIVSLSTFGKKTGCRFIRYLYRSNFRCGSVLYGSRPLRISDDLRTVQQCVHRSDGGRPAGRYLPDQRGLGSACRRGKWLRHRRSSQSG